MTTLPSKARAVIIGGGAVGCSVAYHLTKLGWTDVVLLERKQLTSGTTWHAAGLVGQLRATQNMTRLARYSAELFSGLEAETGVATGFKQNGSILLCLSEHRLEEARRGASMAKVFGVEIEEWSATDIADKYPGLNMDGVLGGLWTPLDGQADPANITHALAKGARSRGAKIFENVKVTAIRQANGHITGIQAEQNGDPFEIDAEVVVNCGGMWGREVGRMAGVNVPLHACEHFYVVTEPIPDLPANLPVLRVPDECAYYKEDAGKILLGAFEPNAKPWGMDGIPEDFCFDQLPEDFEHFEPILENAVNRFPALETVGIHTFFNGPESFTPDDRYLLGEAPELKNFFVAAGFNSVGVQSSGGAGMALAEWIDGGHPPFDLWDVDVRRMMPFQGSKTYLYERSKETLGLLYADHFPYRQMATSRNVRRSPLHAHLKERGACFGEVAGFERANWFAETGQEPVYQYAWGRQNWFDNHRTEHMAVREGVGLFDISSFGKIRVDGPDAADVLQRLAANDVMVDPGRIVYTQFLNERGGIEADVTISRLAEDSFIVVTPGASIIRDMAWIKRHWPEDARAAAIDVTAMEAVIVVMGPNARALLQPLTSVDLSNEAFPFGTMQTIDIGMAQLRAHRISYVGELGWELYVSADMAAHVFETIDAAGRDMGLVYCGLHALDSCRIEKAFRHFGHDISDEDHVLEAGLGFAVKLQKPASRFGGFLGRDAVLRKKESGLERRMMQFRLTDPKPLVYHTEPILRDGEIVSYVTSGNYVHALGAAIGLGYVPTRDGETAQDMLASDYEIEIAGVRVPAEASLKPIY
ncbi:MAG: FAD-dependent oxidoreductase, partial [Pseudomonadota bacterium]